MSATLTAPDPSSQPNPNPAGADQDSRAGRLVALVRRLIDYGKELAATLRQRGTATVPAIRISGFGTSAIALILARITQGLHRAHALEARLIRNAARLDAEARPRRPASPRKPRPARPAAPHADPAVLCLEHLLTPEQIAAEVRRRPIGAVIADICRDLGIVPSHPLWREAMIEIISYGGSLATLFNDTIERVRAFHSPGPTAAPSPTPPAALSLFPAARAGPS